MRTYYIPDLCRTIEYLEYEFTTQYQFVFVEKQELWAQQVWKGIGLSSSN